MSKEGIRPDTLKFGLSILHARIRFLESLLHIAYKLSLKKWQVTLSEEKDIVKERKKSIQQQFKNEMGLIVDMPNSGFDNTNDGNTSRRFFMDPDLSARITGMDSRLIYRFKVILELISSRHKIDPPLPHSTSS